MYDSPLQVSLSENEAKELLGALENAPEKETSFTGYLYYSFDLYDKNDKLIDRIVIDTQKTIKFDSGKNLQRTDELDSIIKSIEQSHNITMDIWDRRPGSGYFSLFDLVSHGQLYEITENNFVKGLNLELSKSQCSEIADTIIDISFSDNIIEPIDKKFVFNFYTNDGATVYTLYLDSNSDVYTEQGYKVDCDVLKAELISLIDG